MVIWSMKMSSLTNLRDDYREALLGFMTAMNEWESSGYKKSLQAFTDDSLEDGLEQSLRNDLLVVFKKYVVDEGRNYDRVENIVCGRSPGSRHLEAHVEGVVLRDWIGESGGRGSLETLTSSTWLWYVEADQLQNVNKSLGEAGILISWKKPDVKKRF
jgi:hypothetical protein